MSLINQPPVIDKWPNPHSVRTLQYCRLKWAVYLQVVGRVRRQAGGSVVIRVEGRGGGRRGLWGDGSSDGLWFWCALWRRRGGLTKTWKTIITYYKFRYVDMLTLTNKDNHIVKDTFQQVWQNLTCVSFVGKSLNRPTMSLKPPSTAAVMMPRKRATMLRMVADHNRW